MKYIYGPVSSRRLGFSLGVSLTPYKICSFDCVYCQLGKTTCLTGERREYLPIGEILEELKTWFLQNPEEGKKLDYLTFSGAGEPTLNTRIGELILEIKKIITVPVCVITNSSLLADPGVRKSLELADLIVPSLDAVTVSVFEKIDRPNPELKIEAIIQGVIDLRREFKGKIWLEVMLVSGFNDDLRHIKKLKEAIDKINPDKIQLNSPVRTAASENLFAVEAGKLKKIQKILGETCEII